MNGKQKTQVSIASSWLIKVKSEREKQPHLILDDKILVRINMNEYVQTKVQIETIFIFLDETKWKPL